MSLRLRLTFKLGAAFVLIWVLAAAWMLNDLRNQMMFSLDQLRELDVKVIFSEMDFPSSYVDTIQRESGVKLYPLSHISYGDYSAEKYEVEMTGNLNTVVRAIQESGA